MQLRQLITRNWFLKVFSILLASLLWLTIASETNSVINRTLALEFQSIPANTEITGETAREVDLQLRGSSNLLNEISPADLAAVVSLVGQTPGEKNLPLSAQNIQTPFGVEVLRVNPPRVQFNLERTLSRQLPVRATVEGEPAEDYVVVGIVVSPSTVQVVGPESRIRPLESLPTTSIRIDGLRESVRESADLNVMDPLVRLQSLSPYEVMIQILEVEVEDIYTITLDPSLDPDLWFVQPSEIEVTIRGPKSLMAEYEPEFVYFTIDTDSLSPGSQEVIPRIIGVNEPLYAALTEPESVEVIVRPEAADRP